MRTTLDMPDTMHRKMKTRTTPPWFGSVKVDASAPHDMASVRESIARHHTAHTFVREVLPPAARHGSHRIGHLDE